MESDSEAAAVFHMFVMFYVHNVRLPAKTRRSFRQPAGADLLLVW